MIEAGTVGHDRAHGVAVGTPGQTLRWPRAHHRLPVDARRVVALGRVDDGAGVGEPGGETDPDCGRW